MQLFDFDITLWQIGKHVPNFIRINFVL